MCTGTPLSTACPQECTGHQQFQTGSWQQGTGFLIVLLPLGSLQGSGPTSSLWKNKIKQKHLKIIPRHLGQDAHGACVRTDSCVWRRWCGTGTAPQSLVQCCRWCTGSPSVWKLSAHTDGKNLELLVIFTDWDQWVHAVGPGAVDGPYVSISFCLVICLRCLLPT